MADQWRGSRFISYPYKRFQDAKMAEIAKERVVIDIGGGGRFQKWAREYEPLFANCDYKTLDYDPTTNPDIVGDIHELPLPDASADAIICYSVLEHVENPNKAASELRRVLKPGGKLLIYVPSIYPYHSRNAHYKDYWRFFDDTLLSLFDGCSVVELQKVGGYFRALFFFIPAQHHLRWFLDPLSYLLDTLLLTHKRTTTSGYIVYAEK